MAYVAWSVVFGEQPSAAKWNILGTNDAAFNAGGGVSPPGLLYGYIRNRKGGTSGDASWGTAGTTSTDTTGKTTFWQAGAVVMNTSFASTAVTFPTAYTQVPLVFTCVQTAGSANVISTAKDVTTSGFNMYTNSASSGATETAAWISVGQ